jgi:hypothetical protein
MILCAHLPSYLNVKFKLKEKFKDLYRSFMQELLELSLVEVIFKFPNFFKQWMVKMKVK